MRKNISIDEETAARLLALTRGDLTPAIYASDSEAIRVAVERLHRYHFHPTSTATDAVLERVRRHLSGALGVIDGELQRRGEQ